MVLSRINTTYLWLSGDLLPLVLKLGDIPNLNCLLYQLACYRDSSLRPQRWWLKLNRWRQRFGIKEIAKAEAKRLAAKHDRVKSARIANRTRCVVNLVNDLELL